MSTFIARCKHCREVIRLEPHERIILFAGESVTDSFPVIQVNVSCAHDAREMAREINRELIAMRRRSRGDGTTR